MTNSWPGGHRHAMHQSEHEAWNAENYPGTLQLCCKCDKPTGRCEDDAIWNDDGDPLCEDCYHLTRRHLERMGKIMSRESVDVAFAIEEGGEVVAVMPGTAGTVNRPDTCGCYAHTSQHSSGCIDYFTDQCVCASPKEYADLLKELGRRGYDVTVIPFNTIENDEYLAARIEQLGA